MTQPVGSRNNPRALLTTDHTTGQRLHEAKSKNAPKPPIVHTAAEAALHGGELAIDVMGAASGTALAVAAPLASMVLNSVAVHEDWKAGQEIGAARERDIKNTAALLLAQESLGETYVNAELARLHQAYDQGSSIDRDAWRISVQKLISRVQAEAGGIDQARKMFNAAADQGRARAAQLHLTDESQIRFQCSVDPDFRLRFESDPVFRHGVEAYAAQPPNGAVTAREKAAAPLP